METTILSKKIKKTWHICFPARWTCFSKHICVRSFAISALKQPSGTRLCLSHGGHWDVPEGSWSCWYSSWSYKTMKNHDFWGKSSNKMATLAWIFDSNVKLPEDTDTYSSVSCYAFRDFTDGASCKWEQWLTKSAERSATVKTKTCVFGNRE